MIGERDLCLGWIHDTHVCAAFMESVLRVISSPLTGRLVARHVSASAGVHVAFARAAVTREFLAGGGESWLWMIDTDMTFTPGLLTRLAATADAEMRPLVTGLYWSPPAGASTTGAGLPLVPMLFGRGSDGRFAPCAGWPDGAVFEVAGCGAGCLLIHRRVLEAVGDDDDAGWREIHDGPVTAGEDLSFCTRAAAAGFTVTADTAARAGHVKTVTVGGDGPPPGGVLPPGADGWHAAAVTAS